MTTPLTNEGYVHTKEKLAQMEARLAALRRRNDLTPVHRAEVERSYEDMIRQYRRDLKLFEATRARVGTESASGQLPVSTSQSSPTTSRE
jgi:hypothetical protein